MARLESSLATELENLTPDGSAVVAAQRFASAYGVYMGGATMAGSPILTTAAAVSAMSGAMVFPLPGTAASAAAVVTAGVTAFWGAMVAAPAAHFAGATVVVPPTAISGLTASLTSVFAGGASQTLTQVAADMAASMHTASTGGTATLASPPPIAIL